MDGRRLRSSNPVMSDASSNIASADALLHHLPRLGRQHEHTFQSLSSIVDRLVQLEGSKLVKENILPPTLLPGIHLTRTSTRRDAAPHRIFHPSSCDIRTHFPVSTRHRLTPIKASFTNHDYDVVGDSLRMRDSRIYLSRADPIRGSSVTTTNSRADSRGNTNSSSSIAATPASVSSTSSSSASSASFLALSPVSRKRSLDISPQHTYEEPSEPKYSRSALSDRTDATPAPGLAPSPAKCPTPRLLSMGAGVKQHPRYQKRTSLDLPPDACAASAPTESANSGNPFAPICSVPMPAGFVFTPAPCAPVPYPWCGPVQSPSLTGKSLVECRTVETQTTPRTSDTSPDFETKGRSNRRSSGANQVLSSLRKTFGQIRRAISADRLNRISDSEAPATPHVNHLQRAGHLLRREHASPPGTNTPSLANPVASSAVKPRLVRRRSVSPCSLTAGRLAAHRHLDTRNQLPLARLQPSEAVKCSIIERHPDGSLLVQLKRSSIDGQFGFFIAKDINGIYVSRLADVKSAAALWDVFHVGDRLVSVQGIPCTGNSEVADVRNLVANRRYVQILIRPATTCGVVTRNRSHGIKILKSPRCPQDALMR